MAEVKQPERMMQLFSLMMEAKTERHYLHLSALTITYWHVGRRINQELPGGKRAE